MKIGEIDVGSDHPPFFIAEAGVNHNGNLDTAKKLIDIAADAGADAIKFQTFSADRLVTPEASKAEYQTETTGEGSQYDMLKRYELNRESHEILLKYCMKNDIMFLSTPFDSESVDMLVDLGVPAIKLGSGELNNYPLIEYVAKTDLPMIVSTGMGTMNEVKAAYSRIKRVNPSAEVVFLHCTASYPCDLDDVNLRAMQTMAEELTVPVGYSDHTLLPETPALAVTAGATIVEKHFTMDRSLPGPDHEASLEPDELTRAVDLIETAAKVLGSAEKCPTDTEQESMDKSRKGLYAAVDISSDSKIRAEDIDVLRPATGLSPSQYDVVVGAYATTDIATGEPITAADVDSVEEVED